MTLNDTRTFFQGILKSGEKGVLEWLGDCSTNFEPVLLLVFAGEGRDRDISHTILNWMLMDNDDIYRWDGQEIIVGSRPFNKSMYQVIEDDLGFLLPSHAASYVADAVWYAGFWD